MDTGPADARVKGTFFVNGILQDVSCELETLRKRFEAEVASCDPNT